VFSRRHPDPRSGSDVTADPALLTIAEARDAIDRGQLSALELTESVLRRIERLDAELGAYLRVDADAALEQARAVDGQAGEQLPLKGIPVCVKDLIDVAGVPTTAGSATWRRTPARDAAAVARLRRAGAVIVGKGHTNEFAYGIDGRNPHFRECRNPYDPARLPGGSSSGPAVATAAGMALGGLGTDTTGSIRVPASLCGLVGIRPTLARIPVSGVVPLAWSYDTVGPLARTVADAAICFGALTDASGGEGPTGSPGSSRPDPDVRGYRIGVIEQLFEDVEPYVESGLRDAVNHLEAEGAEVSAVQFERLRHANAIHHIVQHAEAAQAHAPWFETQYDHYTEPVRLRLEVGRLLPASAYLTAQQARRLLIDEAAQKLERLDALLAPAAPCIAPFRDSDDVTIRGVPRDMRSALLSCVLAPSELACPVASVPIGSHQGLPFGMQIIGRPMAEPLLLSIASVCERRSTPELARLG
jgi:aspartyl-tRNA(Asn)/glutamyl-tRNA(Gln) amidotransferase subunit A